MRLLPVLALTALLTAPNQSPALTPGSVLLMAGGTSVDPAVLAAALADANPLVRAAAARVIAVFAAGPLGTQALAALEKETDPRAGGELIRTTLLLNVEGAARIAESHAQRLGGEAATILTQWQQRPSGSAAVPGDEMPSRLVPLWLPGLLRELSDAARCKLPGDPQFGYTRITYRGDGRPLSVAIDPGGLSRECSAVLSAIGRTTLADPEDCVQHGQQQWIVVPFSKHYAECSERRETAPAARVGLAGIRAPKKVKDVRPGYPEELRRQGVQGLVLIGATISAQGCVVGGRAVKSPALGLELAALRAVSGWVFEPTLLDGKPVPVWMTVTVNFRLE
jgi:protein TonB